MFRTRLEGDVVVFFNPQDVIISFASQNILNPIQTRNNLLIISIYLYLIYKSPFKESHFSDANKRKVFFPCSISRESVTNQMSVVWSQVYFKIKNLRLFVNSIGKTNSRTDKQRIVLDFNHYIVERENFERLFSCHIK